MINIALINCLILTLVLSLISFVFTQKVNKTWISASFAYWFAWVFILIASLICEYNGWNYTKVTPLACISITRLHYGAVLGFAFGSLLAGKQSFQAKVEIKKKFLLQAEWVVNQISGKILIFLFFVGIVFLDLQISQVGFNTDTVAGLRQLYLERNFSLTNWLGNHLYMFASTIILLVGAVDAYRGVKFKRILIFIAASAPISLAQGGRTFLLQFLLLYFFSFLCMRSTLLAESKINLVFKKEALQVFGILAICLFLFSLLGFNRANNLESFNPAQLILSWPASSIAALDSWIRQAISTPLTYGVHSFLWPVSVLDRLGIVNTQPAKQILANIIIYFGSVGDSAGVIPRTIIPDLIFDFGIKGIFWGMLCASFCLQITSIRLAGKGIFVHSLAAMSLQAAFMTIQGSIFTPGFCVVLFWALMINIYLNSFKQKPYVFTAKNNV